MNLAHPNAHLTPETVRDVLCVAANAFRRCNMQPRQAEFDGCDSFIAGELGRKRFLVYVRITQGDEQEQGCGPVPGILIDAAVEQEAEPHLIRVHTRRVGEGTAFTYFGYEEFIRHVLSHDAEFAASLLAPRKFSDYVRLLKGNISKLELGLREEGDAGWLTLQIDGAEPYGYVICPASLLASSRKSDDYEIFTCTCGHAGCNGIHRGVRVVHEGSLTLWKAYYARGRRVFLFDQEEYRHEILKKCKNALEFARSSSERYCVPFEGDHGKKWLEKAYFEATDSR
jgi:hypothetical protein